MHFHLLGLLRISNPQVHKWRSAFGSIDNLTRRTPSLDGVWNKIWRWEIGRMEAKEKESWKMGLKKRVRKVIFLPFFQTPWNFCAFMPLSHIFFIDYSSKMQYSNAIKSDISCSGFNAYKSLSPSQLGLGCKVPILSIIYFQLWYVSFLTFQTKI